MSFNEEETLQKGVKMDAYKIGRIAGESALILGGTVATVAMSIVGAFAGAGIVSGIVRASVNPKTWKSIAVIAGFYAGAAAGAFGGTYGIVLPAGEMIYDELTEK